MADTSGQQSVYIIQRQANVAGQHVKSLQWAAVLLEQLVYCTVNSVNLQQGQSLSAYCVVQEVLARLGEP